MALMMSSSGTMVALGRFSAAQSAPVVPAWTAIFFSAASRVSRVSSEPTLVTRDWLESTYGSDMSTSALRASVMVIPAMAMSAVPPALMVGTSESKAWLGSQLTSRPMCSARALDMSMSKPTGSPVFSSMDSNGGKYRLEMQVSLPSLTRVYSAAAASPSGAAASPELEPPQAARVRAPAPMATDRN